jgi:hypothetical protein
MATSEDYFPVLVDHVHKWPAKSGEGFILVLRRDAFPTFFTQLTSSVSRRLFGISCNQADQYSL